MKLALSALLVAIVVVGLLLVPLPAETRLAKIVIDTGHTPLFALLTVLMLWPFRHRPPRTQRWAAVGVAALLVVFAGGSEFIQHFTGRGPSWRDIFANFCGIAAGLLWMLRRSATRTLRSRGLAAAAVATIVVGELAPLAALADFVWQHWQVPVLASFESSSELLRWDGNRSRLARVQTHASEGNWALRVELRPGEYPGAALDPPANWSRYEELRLDVFLDAGPPLPLIVKIEDRLHNLEPEDRFDRLFQLEPGENHLRIPLADVAAAPRERAMDLSQIAFMQIFTLDLEHPRTIYLDNIRLR